MKQLIMVFLCIVILVPFTGSCSGRNAQVFPDGFTYGIEPSATKYVFLSERQTYFADDYELSGNHIILSRYYEPGVAGQKWGYWYCENTLKLPIQGTIIKERN